MNLQVEGGVTAAGFSGADARHQRRMVHAPKLRPTMQCHVGPCFASKSFLMYAATSFSTVYFSSACSGRGSGWPGAPAVWPGRVDTALLLCGTRQPALGIATKCCTSRASWAVTHAEHASCRLYTLKTTLATHRQAGLHRILLHALLHVAGLDDRLAVAHGAAGVS